MTQLTNKTYDQLSVGDSITYKRTVTDHRVDLFAAAAGDTNPVHLDDEFAKTTQFGERIAHGMLSGAFISAALALYLPGPGSIYIGQTLSFRRPVKIGDELTVTLTVKEKLEKRKWVIIDCVVTNQDGKEVVLGEATALPPAENMTIEMPEEPKFQRV